MPPLRPSARSSTFFIAAARGSAIALFVLVFWTLTPARQNKSLPLFNIGSCERKALHAAFPVHRQIASGASSWFDVTYYKLDLTVSPTDRTIAGSVLIKGITNQNEPPFIIFDLMNSLTVDSILIDGTSTNFSQQLSTITLFPPVAYPLNSSLTIVIHYHGTPSYSGLGSYVVTTHGGDPWVWSLSEPYGARDWWPCKDTPSDKADSADIFITTGDSLTVASEGTLVSLHPNLDGTSTWHWHEQYPIATYLVSVVISKFATFTDWFTTSSGDSMPVTSYVFAESLEAAHAASRTAIAGLGMFSGMFGPYPFAREKYGHAEAGGDAMEHQTMTSLPAFDDETVVHELAHHWFGDMITCRSWSDVWLNEGFATYCAALYFEHVYGIQAYHDYLDFHLQRAKNADRPVVTSDTSDVRTLFNGARVYSKGAAVLHMLRHVVGDSLFFRSLAAYAGDTAFRYGTASTDDFRRSCERTCAASLRQFFDQWLYGNGFPTYQYSWHAVDSAGRSVVTLTLSQSTPTNDPPLFTMPVDIRFAGSALDTTVTIANAVSPQSYHFIFTGTPQTVTLDPQHWLLCESREVGSNQLPVGFLLEQNFPNPFNGGTSIRFEIPHRASVDIAVYDLAGRKIATLLHEEKTAGKYEIHWDPAQAASGVYFCRMKVSGLQIVRQLTLIR